MQAFKLYLAIVFLLVGDSARAMDCSNEPPTTQPLNELTKAMIEERLDAKLIIPAANDEQRILNYLSEFFQKYGFPSASREHPSTITIDHSQSEPTDLKAIPRHHGYTFKPESTSEARRNEFVTNRILENFYGESDLDRILKVDPTKKELVEEMRFFLESEKIKSIEEGMEVLLNNFHLTDAPQNVTDALFKATKQKTLPLDLKFVRQTIGALSRIPEAFRKNHQGQFIVRLDKQSGLHGAAEYHPNLKLLGFPNFNLVRGPGTYLHEFGHAVWFALSKSWQRKYEAIGWKNGKIISENLFATEYSKSNLKEDFADHFMLYVLEPDRLMKDYPSRHKFFTELQEFLKAQ